MKMVKMGFGLLGLSLLLSACQSPSSNTVKQTHYFQLNQKCPTLLNVKVGETIVFKASENLSTGYSWHIVNPLRLFSMEEGHLAKEVPEGFVGAPGEKTYRFTAIKPGQELIEVHYIRPWETDKHPAEQWQCRVQIV